MAANCLGHLNLLFTILFFVNLYIVHADQHDKPLDDPSFGRTHPHNITIETVSYTFILISWEPPLDNVTDILNYQVKYSVHWDRRHEQVRNVAADTHKCHLKALMTGTIYYFYVVANYSNGKLLHSNTESKMTLGYGKDHQCNCTSWGSNSSLCNNQTGQCPCKTKYTMGRRCDSCYTGYYFHPNLGCEKCDCPAKFSNGSCFVDDRGLPLCYCIDGHAGTQCQVCARGYYMYKELCKPCMCNFNENPKADMVCTNHGRCVACMYNTTGEHCEVCLSGYVGDAIHHNCTLVASVNLSHQAIVVVAVCLTIITIIVIIIVIILYARWRRCHDKPFSFWTVQLNDDHENVNFSAIVNQHDPSSIDAELLANDEVQFAAKEKPTLTFGSARHPKT